MPRQVPRRTPAAPSTPPTAPFQQQTPPVAAATATTPVFATPPGFQQGIELFPSGNHAWQQQQRRSNQPMRPGSEAVVATTTSEPGDETDVENDHIDDRARAMDFDGLVDGEEDDEDVEEELDEEDVEGDEENEEMREQRKSPSPLPPDLREISSLASWTVSTHKPGCGVAALRNPSPLQFWQSDGPQPHTLTLHFFKLVAIVKLRVYLDFDLDESYTPTKMQFFAGMGGNDLVEFASWEGESPAGWVNISLDGVGGRNRRRKTSVKDNRRRTQHSRVSKGGALPISSGIEANSDELGVDNFDDLDYDEDDEEEEDPDDPYSGNVLKAMVVQVRICENHQNGKDTHVRGFQVFAHDDDRRRVAAAAAAAAAASGNAAQPGHERKSMQPGSQDVFESLHDGLGEKARGLEEPDWMGEPVVR